MIAAILLGALLGGQTPPADPCALAKAAGTAEARAGLFRTSGRFGRTGEALGAPPFGIREALDGVAADRAGNDRYELEFETRDCRADGGRARVTGLVHHAGWSNEPGTGERYPASFAASFVEEWVRDGAQWTIETWQIGPFSPSKTR